MDALALRADERRDKLRKKKFNSNHLLAIFIVVCGLLAGISVFAGGRIPGAVKMATIWLIPKDAEKPADRRFKNTKK